MKSGLRRTLALALGLCTLTAGASAASVTFRDVPSSYWGYPYITKAASNGLVSGLGDGRYGPQETLSNAHFVTMVCGMFYEDEVSAQSSSSDWWRPYLNAAYSAGILKGTQAAQQRASAGDWTASVANAKISRYDMAQIMYNVATAQGFEEPSAASLAYSSVRIRDFSSVPSSYQYAVLYSYAKGFLSGDQNGRFNGGSSTTRAEAAVVLCSLFEEQESLLSPTYNNSNRLTDNSAVTEENVSDLLRELEAEYPSFDRWNTDRVYTSKVLGRGSGEAGFAYMLSDRVFGAISSYELDDPEDLRVGDLLKLDSGSTYGVVVSRDGNRFTYASCDEDGWISWSRTKSLDDLDRSDTVYSRYLTKPSGGKLANGNAATERNVSNLLDDLKKDYEQGDSWNEDKKYTSDVLGSGYEDKAFSYFLSDKIFDELEDSSVRKAEDLRVGDLIYDDHEEKYGLVLSVDTRNETVDYVTVDDDHEIDWKGWCDFDDLSDMITRYPDEEEDGDQGDNELANGKAATERNVSSLLDDLKKDYEPGDSWDEDDKYTSDVLGSGYADKAFAYFISDKVFGDLDDSPVRKAKDLRVGDVVYDDNMERYGVVLQVDTSDDTVQYATVEDEKLKWGYWCEFDDLTDMLTRYPDDSGDQGDDELANGKAATERNVSSLLDDLKEDYEQGDSWNEDKKYTSDVLGSGYEDKAFAYFISDKIFGDLDDSSVRKPEDLKAGDLVYDDYEEKYGIVLSIDTSDEEVYYVTVDDDNEIDWDFWGRFDDLDEMYTRYP